MEAEASDAKRSDAAASDVDLDLTQRSGEIDVDEAARVLERLRSPLRAIGIAMRSGRPTAAGALVTVAAPEPRRVFVKRFAPGTAPPRTIAPIHRFAAQLRSRGIGTPRMLPFAHGAGGAPTLLELEGCVYEVSEEAEGEDRYRSTPSWSPPGSAAEAEGIGRATARLAIAASCFAEPAAPVGPFRSAFELLADPEAVDRWLSERPAVRCYALDAGRPLRDDVLRQHEEFVAPMEELLPRLGSSWVHGDLHASNLFWRGPEPVTVIDLGIAGRVFPLYDLAVAVERNALLWPEILRGRDDAVRFDVLESLLRGYHRLRPLSDVERSALPRLLPVCQSEAALHWIEYQYGVWGDRASADWSYEQYFRAHAEWFRTPGGRRLTDRLREIVDRLPDAPDTNAVVG